MMNRAQKSRLHREGGFGVFEGNRIRELRVVLRTRNRRLGGGEAGDRHAVGRAAYVGEPDSVAEFYRLGVAAVFAADAEFDVGAGALGFFNGDFHELADAALVDGGEGVLRHDLGFLIRTEEGAGVVARHAEGRLREVVGSEAEELGGLGDFVGGERTAWHFDHGANLVGEFYFFLFLNVGGDFVDEGDLLIELLLKADERDHDLGLGLEAFLGRFGGGFEDSADLHFGNLGVFHAEAATAEAEHGVELVEFVHAGHDLLDGDADLLGEVELLLLAVGEELVERRVEEADGGGEAVEGFEDAKEVLALVGQELGEGSFAGGLGLGENHLAHGVDAVAFEEHVFGAGEADAFRAKGEGLGGLLGGVGVGADFELRGLLTPVHELDVVFEFFRLLRGFVAVEEAVDDFGGRGGDLARVNGARCAVDGEVIAFGEVLAFDGGDAAFVVDLDVGCAADADFAHLAGNEGSVRGDAAASGEDAFGSDHAAKVFGRGLDADEENFLAFFGGFYGAVGVEVDLAGGRTGASGQAGRDRFGFLDFGEVEDGREELFELVGGVAQDGGLPVDESFLNHVGGELECGSGGAFAVARLEHVELAVLDGELDVLNVLEVFFEGFADFEEFGVGFGHGGLELGNGLGGAHAGDDVFALGVDEELAVKFVFAVGGVAGKGDAGAGGFTGVAEDHCLDVNGGAPLGGDVVFAAVNDRAVVHPRAEDCTGCAA